MVELMRGVVAGGGTAAGASAAGQPLAGKTGTENDHTDVWFIGYTPTYSTGVWMGNPERKESLGAGMTGGHGALPFFNAFMNVFMKGKKIESFPSAPSMPSEIKLLMERNRREELEKLENAVQESIKSGALTKPTPLAETPADVPPVENPDGVKTSPVGDPPPMRQPVQQPPPAKNPDPPPTDKPEGTKPKGKKGDG